MRELVAVALMALLALPLQAQDTLLGPQQPASGPGGSLYKHARVVQNTFLEGDDQYWLFEPASPRPTQPAPVIVLLHGWGGMSPYGYGAWIEHLVRRGNIVLYPRYQASMLTPPGSMTPAAIRSIKDALGRLDGKTHLQADKKRFALAGHSLGASLAANIAAQAGKHQLPKPGAVLVIQPGDSHGKSGWRSIMPSLLADHSQIPKQTLLVVLVGAEDRVVGDMIGKKIFEGATGVAPRNKNLLILTSDRRGQPALIASHRQPFAPDRRFNGTGQQTMDALSSTDGTRSSAHLNAHDFYGNWKLLDALTDAAFYGKNRRYALGNTREQRFMGKWSDGTPIHELKVILGKRAAKKAKAPNNEKQRGADFY